jgi:cellulose biosynthesis protein BcsE
MIMGGMYALVAETPPARFPILSGTLASALRDGLHCTVIVPSDPKSFIQRLASFGNSDLASMLGSGTPRFFTMQAEFAKKMFQFGADSFVQELEHFEVPPGSYLIFDQADELLSLHDITLASDQVDIIRKWCLEHRVTLLLVFTRASESDTSTLNALMDSLTGMTHLGADKDGLELTFDYWQSLEGTVAARYFRLSTLDSGLYEATLKIVQSESAEDSRRFADEEEAAGAELHFFYMDPDLGSLAKQMKGTWHHVGTLVGMMHATRSKRTATCLLTYERDTNLRQLAEAVHTLRLSLGRRARIVVQEKDASLRYQNEALLLRLGVNLIVNRDVPASRLPLLLDSLMGQVFTRDVDINFEAALTSVLPTRLRGYLQPTRFVREVQAILSQGETLSIPSALIIGKPNADFLMTDILTNSGLKRPGDLITADKEYCYIFLNACPQAVMLATLDRILGRSADDIFDDVRFVVKSEEFHSSLDALTLIAGRAELPDYSSLFAPQPVSDETPIAASSTSVVPLHASTDGTGDTGAGRAAGYAGAYSGEVKSIRSAFPKESTEQPRTVNPFAGDSSLPASRSQTPRSAPTPIGRMAPPRASRSKSS